MYPHSSSTIFPFLCAEFERDVYQVTLNENSPPGTTVVQVKAEDKDSGVFGTEGIRYTGLTGSIANE